MHSAPSVNYPVGRSKFAGALLLAAWLLGAAVTALWWFEAQSPGWRLWAAFLALFAAGAFAAWNWRHCAQGSLQWDGETWSWSADGAVHAGVPQVSLDLQHWLLLRWKSDNVSGWLWLERAWHAERWDDLRRAVYCRAEPQTLPRRAPVAKP